MNKNGYIFSLILLALCFFLPHKAAAAPRVSNLNDIGTATVSWSTDFSSTATVYYRRQGTSSFDSASDSENTYAHYVKITGLTEDTDYEYYVCAGSLTDDNNGTNYILRTLPSGAPTLPGNNLDIGEIRSGGGSESGKAIVYLKAYKESYMESCLISARVDKGSGWSYILGNMLTIDGGPYLWQEGLDTLAIEVDGVDECLVFREYEFESGLTDIPVIRLEKVVYGTIPIACEQEGTLTSPLRIGKGLTTYGISLVDPSDPQASRIRIKTPAGIKALKKL